MSDPSLEINTERKLLFIGKTSGFSQRTCDAVDQTPFLPNFGEQSIGRSPVGQRSIKSDLGEFILRSKNRPKNDYLDVAIQRTLLIFQLPQKVKIMHLIDVFQQDLDIWTKSPGSPWCELGYKTRGDIKNDPEAVQSVRKCARSVKDGCKIDFPDCLAFARSHTCELGEYKVWSYPATVTFMEAMFAIPLIRAYQEVRDEFRPIAYGFEIVTGGMNRLCQRFRCPGAHYTGIDFKKFDKTVPPWLIEVAFDILLLFNIDLAFYQDHGIPDSLKMHTMFCALRKYFIQTTIRTADGCRFQKFSGIASGSYFTQLIGSIVNSILINWMSIEQFGSFPLDCVFFGDDSFISSTQKWDLDWCNAFVKKIGMEINVKKSGQSECMGNLKFLGYRIGNGQPIN